jgi:hypothetical protein
VVIDRRSQTRGQAIENAYTFEGNEVLLRIRPGRHVFTVRSADDLTATSRELIIDPAARSTLELTLVPKEQPKTTTPTAGRDQGTAGGGENSRGAASVVGPLILGAVGAAVVGGGVVMGVIARSKTNEIEDACPNDSCPTTYPLNSERRSARTFGTVADASFIGGGVMIAGAVVWYLLLPKGGSSKPATRARAAGWLPSAVCTHDGCGVTAQRSF